MDKPSNRNARIDRTGPIVAFGATCSLEFVEGATGCDCITCLVQPGLCRHFLPTVNWRSVTCFSGNFLIVNLENFYPVFDVSLTEEEEEPPLAAVRAVVGWTCFFFSFGSVASGTAQLS